MTLTEVSLDFLGRKLPFRFPDSGNIRDHLRNILTGQDYPRLPVPPGYKIQTIVDVGANIGAAALWFLAAAPEARLVCFEPAQENFECLCYNLQAFPRAECYCYGLFSCERTATLHLGTNQCMQHSIAASPETGNAVEIIDLKRASTELDRLGIDRVSILKVDTEGCEVPILRDLGAKRLSQVDGLYLEWHSDADRRRVDGILGDAFLLAHAAAHSPHRGNAAYLSAVLAAQIPNIAALRIDAAEE
jgi:FkbM family methyltransferase